MSHANRPFSSQTSQNNYLATNRIVTSLVIGIHYKQQLKQNKPRNGRSEVYRKLRIVRISDQRSTAGNAS